MCWSHCSCCQAALDVTATIKINSPPSLLCVSCLSQSFRKGICLARPTSGFHCALAAKGQEGRGRACGLCSGKRVLLPVRTPTVADSLDTWSGFQLGSLNTCRRPFPLHTLTPWMNRPFQSHSLQCLETHTEGASYTHSE